MFQGSHGRWWNASARPRPLPPTVMLPHLLLFLVLVLAPRAALAADTPISAAGGMVSPACLLQVTAHDARGAPVLQTVGYRLDRPELVVVPLHALEKEGVRWESLSVAPDPLEATATQAAASLRVGEAVAVDPARDLLFLRAPGLKACDAPPPATAAPSVGERLVGVRERSGYRTRLFAASVDRSIPMPDGTVLLRVEVDDGGPAGTGFLLDVAGGLAGSILPSTPGADPDLACAVALPDAGPPADVTPAATPRASVRPSSRPSFLDSAAGILSRVLLLTRPDRAPEALDLLADMARRCGEFPGLLLERGAWNFRAGRTDLAIDDFSRIASANPTDHLSRFNLGIALGATGHYEAAAEALQSAAALAPQHAPTHYQLALAYLAANRPAAARRQLERLSAIEPGLAADLRSLAGF
jgi:hypothetical protein